MNDPNVERPEDAGAERPNVSRASTANVVIPIGTQTIRFPAHTINLPSSGAIPPLEGTRVWVGRASGRLVVHLGDVEEASLDAD